LDGVKYYEEIVEEELPLKQGLKQLGDTAEIIDTKG